MILPFSWFSLTLAFFYWFLSFSVFMFCMFPVSQSHQTQDVNYPQLSWFKFMNLIARRCLVFWSSSFVTLLFFFFNPFGSMYLRIIFFMCIFLYSCRQASSIFSSYILTKWSNYTLVLYIAMNQNPSVQIVILIIVLHPHLCYLILIYLYLNLFYLCFLLTCTVFFSPNCLWWKVDARVQQWMGEWDFEPSMKVEKHYTSTHHLINPNADSFLETLKFTWKLSSCSWMFV